MKKMFVLNIYVHILLNKKKLLKNNMLGKNTELILVGWALGAFTVHKPDRYSVTVTILFVKRDG